MIAKKVRPTPCKIEGLFAYYCNDCITEWLLKEERSHIGCPDCGKQIRKIVEEKIFSKE